MLRPYQQESVDRTWQTMRDDKESRPLIVLPTGAGKSHVLAAIAHQAVERYGVRVLVLTHVRELVEQNVEKLRLADETLDVGVYSAGLNSRDVTNDVIVASVQSVYKRIHELSQPKPFSLVIIDEAHLIPLSGDGMYRQALKALQVINPRARLCGLTATPFRLTTGWLVGSDQPFSVVSHDVNVRELIDDGYLCPPVTKWAEFEAETSDLHIRQGEFIAEEMSDRFMSVFMQSMNEMFAMTAERRSVLVFCSSVEHAMACQDFAEGLYYKSAVVTGETPPAERDDILSRFKAGAVRYLFNVNVLTTGFDAPNCDAVVLLRSTMSPGLYVQMVGRGFRLHPGKRDFLVLDFGQNVKRHGPIDDVNPPRSRTMLGQAGEASEPRVKKCPQCKTIWLIGQRVCEECDHVFEFKPQHDATAADDPILSDKSQAVTFDNRDVTQVEYQVWHKRGAPASHPSTLRVTYHCGYDTVSEWICVEHEPGSFAHRKATEWWSARCEFPMPDTAEDAVSIAEAGHLKTPQWVRVKREPGERFESVVGYFFGLQTAVR